MSENETPENPQPVDPTATPPSDAVIPNPDAAPSPDLDEQVVAPEPLPSVNAAGQTDAALSAPLTSAEHGGHILPGHPAPAAEAAPGYAAPGYAAPEYAAPGYAATGYAASVAPGHPSMDAPVFAGAADDAAQTGTAASSKKLPIGAVIGLVAAGAVVVLALGAAIAVPLITGGGGGESRPSAELTEPEQLVFDYLTALSEGDATAARKFVESDTYDQSLLTDEVLAISLEAGPIADIEVGRSRAGEYDSISVPVTFTIGGEDVSRTFEVWELGDEFLLIDGVERIPNYGFEALPLSVNGVEIGDDAVIFPGTYELTVDSEYFEVAGGESIVIDGGANSPSMYSLSPELSDAGIEAYRELVGASLQECLDMKTLSTPCGLSVEDAARDGSTPVDGTVIRTLTAEGKSQLAALDARVSENAVVTTWDYIEIDMSFDATDGSETRSMTAFGGSDLKEPKVDFAAETPSVVWE